jgi:hypothetical protein
MDTAKLIRTVALGGIVAGSLGYATLTGAATQGTLGPGSSVGTTDLTVTITEQVLINNLTDIALTYVAPTSPLVGLEPFCVYSGTGDYQITIASTNGTGTFDAVNGGDANALQYTVRVDDTPTLTTPVAVTEDVQVPVTFSDSGATSACGVDNAAIDVTFIEGGGLNDLDGLTRILGDYTDTLTLTVVPF